jgi:hypothetical protein
VAAALGGEDHRPTLLWVAILAATSDCKRRRMG